MFRKIMKGFNFFNYLVFIGTIFSAVIGFKFGGKLNAGLGWICALMWFVAFHIEKYSVDGFMEINKKWAKLFAEKELEELDKLSK